MEVGKRTGRFRHRKVDLLRDGIPDKKMPRVDLDGRVPEFILCSQGLGYQYALDNPEKVKRAELQIDGKQIPVPKYYIKK